MKIIIEGKVVFENGKITEISGFKVDDGNLDDLRKYVEDHYKFSIKGG